MLGIRSYKELHYWESLWPNRNPGLHNWYIILLSNLNYQTQAMRLVFNNYEYLHYRTKNIRYFFPGLFIIRKTKCYRGAKRNVIFVKRNVYNLLPLIYIQKRCYNGSQKLL